MSVAMKDDAHRIPAQRLLESARSQKGHDLERLTLHGGPHRGVVEEGDPFLRAQAGQRRLELQRFVNGLVDEAFDDVLTPWTERVHAEAPGKALDPDEAHALDLPGIAVQQVDPDLAQDG